MGSIVVTFPKRTSGMYNAQTTCAQPLLSVFFRAPSREGHSSQRTREVRSWDSHLRQYQGPVGTVTIP